MNLFTRLRRKNRKEDDLVETLQNSLKILESMGIRAKDEDFIDWLIKEWGSDNVASDPYALMLYTLGSEREINGSWIPLSDDIYTFDTECICDGTDYVSIIERLSGLTKGEFFIEEIHATVDHDSQTVSLSFENNGMTYSWNPLYQEDWFDCTIISKLNLLLKEQNSKKIFYNSSGDQNMTVIFASEDSVRALNQLISVPFQVI